MGSSIKEIEQRWKPIEYRMDRPAQRVRWAAESDMRVVLARIRELEAECVDRHKWRERAETAEAECESHKQAAIRASEAFREECRAVARLEAENARLRETVQQLEEENENLHADLESIENIQWNSLTLEEREKIIKESCK